MSLQKGSATIPGLEKNILSHGDLWNISDIE
jgi:hypothetical protein